MKKGQTKEKQSRLTKQRRIILEELRKVCTHPTVEQIHKMVVKKMPKISLATVYRNLEFLTGKKEIIKLRSKDKKARYDGNNDCHCHLMCKKCGKVIDIFDCQKILVKSKELEKSGFQVDCGHLEIPGLCKVCYKKQIVS